MARIYLFSSIKISSRYAAAFLLGFCLCYMNSWLKGPWLIVYNDEVYVDPSHFFVNTFNDFHVYSNYSVSNNKLCHVEGENSSVYMLHVFTSFNHFQQRKVIRNTWGKKFLEFSNQGNVTGRLKYAFIIGQPSSDNETERELLLTESDTYNDIIQDRFLDTYYNLTLKSLSMLRWTSLHCSNVQYLLKIDDDVEFLPTNLFKLLRTAKYKKKMDSFLLGYRYKTYKPIRQKKSKWYNPFNISYDGPFLAGPSYVITGDLIEKLWVKSKKVTLFYLEDVYVTGILAQSIDATLLHSSTFCLSQRKPKLIQSSETRAFFNKLKKKSSMCTIKHYM